MIRSLYIIILLLFSSNFLVAQQQKRYNYGNVAAKISNGNTSMQVAVNPYNSNTLQAGNFKSQPGFLSILASSNAADSLALVDLYNATNPGDTTWVNADGWLSAPIDQWSGITLDPSGRVVEVWLADNNLTGVLPESLKNLDSLKRFYFWNNPELSGNLFDFLINYPVLERVSAHDCSFTGTILPEVFRPGLLEIRVFNNQITGEIPIEIGNALLMDQFNVSGNLLTGTIPTSIGELKNVRELNLSGNDITGNLPPEVGQMDSLRFLFLENMNLEGEVTAEMLNCPSLIEFWFSGNNFSGTLPDVLNLPNFRVLAAGGNSNLLVDLPDNIGELTQLEVLSIWDTRPNGGAFPEGIYNLTNLRGLDLSDQQFTGMIDERIGNLVNLESLYLRNNLLEDAFPIEITAATNLNTLDLSSNNLNFIPDISSMSALQNIHVQFNQLQFESLIPFTSIGLGQYTYAPQLPIGESREISLPIGGSTNLTTDINDFNGSSYQWIFNRDSLNNATAANLQIENFSTSRAGAYILRATNPNLPDLTLNSSNVFLKIDGNQRTWYIDNRSNSIADFRTLLQAINATKAGDTLYIAGSATPYAGGVSLNSPRVLIGPGYFLEENIETQFNKQSAVIDGVINITNNIAVGGRLEASGTKVFGLDINQLFVQNVISVDDTLANIEIAGVKINRIFLGGSTKDLIIKRSFITDFEILGEAFGNSTLSSYRENNLINNNIIQNLKPFPNSVGFSNALTNISAVDFSFNTIDTIKLGLENLVIENSLIRSNVSNNLTSTGSIIGDYSSVLQNNSGTFSIDNDFQSIDSNLPRGAFAGDTPYILGGLPPVPAIFNIEIGQRLSAKVNAKTISGENITRLRYLYRRNNQSSSAFSVIGFDPTGNLEIEFLPNRSVIQPNQTYDLVFQAIDETGKRSHRTYIPYEAIAANLSGRVVDIDNINVTAGNVRLFAINPFANKYDTAAVQALNGSNTFNFENLILGDYIILADPNETQYPNLIPTYLGNTLDWQVADTLFLENNVSGITIQVEKEPEASTVPGSQISGFLEEEYDEADTSLRVLPRRRVSGAGVSVRTLAGSSRLNGSLRLLDDEYVLVAYTKTDENGDFSFTNLPTGDYRIRIEYPGVEVDETSDIDFNLSGQQGEEVSVEALVEDGLIKVTETGRVTANEPDKMTRFSFYPNPVKNELNLNLENAIEGNEMLIFDLKGVIHRKIKIENGQTTIDIKELAAGTYIIRMQDNKGNYVMSKMIKL